MACSLRDQGFAVQVEKALGKGKSVDLEARRDGRRIAVEVETGKFNAIHNVRKDLEARYDQVLVVCLDGIKEKIRSRLDEVNPSGKDQLAVVSLAEVLSKGVLRLMA